MFRASASGDFSAFIPPGLLVGSILGRSWRREIEPPLAVCALPGSVIVLDRAGLVTRHHVLRTPILQLADGPWEGPCAVAPDGLSVFAGGRLRGVKPWPPPFEIDFFVGWTYALFSLDGNLTLAFESGQPWSESGSYGDRYGGLQVFPPGDPARLLSIEFDRRAFDETFAPRDAVWHPRGVLAWIREDELFIQRCSSPTTSPRDRWWPKRDSDLGLDLAYDTPGPYQSLALDHLGARLAARTFDGVEVFDLRAARTARVDGLSLGVELVGDQLVRLTPALELEASSLAALQWTPWPR